MSLVWELQAIEKREALRRVLTSSRFQGSHQLKSLLQFVCERELAGLGDGLSEYTVAIEGLGRPEHYSPFEDGTVRNRVHNLRRRLDQYYEVEQPDDPVRIVLPEKAIVRFFDGSRSRPAQASLGDYRIAGGDREKLAVALLPVHTGAARASLSGGNAIRHIRSSFSRNPVHNRYRPY